MALYDQQLGASQEVTYGTRVVPSRFFEFVSEGIERQQENRESAGLRKGRRVQRYDRQSQSNKGASGPIVVEVGVMNAGFWLKNVLRKSPTIVQPDAVGAPNTYEHTYALGDEALSMTVQVGRPSTDGTVRPFDYLGAVVSEATLSQELDAYATLGMTVDAQDAKSDQTLAAASYTVGQTYFHDGHFSVTVGGTPFHPSTADLTIDLALALERFFLRASTLKKQPIVADLAVITGSLQGEFESLTMYDRFTAGTIVTVVYDWVGDIIESTYRYELKVTMPNCRIEQAGPTVGGPGILEQPVPFTVLWNAVTDPISVLYRTTQAAS